MAGDQLVLLSIRILLIAACINSLHSKHVHTFEPDMWVEGKSSHHSSLVSLLPRLQSVGDVCQSITVAGRRFADFLQTKWNAMASHLNKEVNVTNSTVNDPDYVSRPGNNDKLWNMLNFVEQIVNNRQIKGIQQDSAPNNSPVDNKAGFYFTLDLDQIKLSNSQSRKAENDATNGIPTSPSSKQDEPQRETVAPTKYSKPKHFRTTRNADLNIKCGYLTCDGSHQWCDTVARDCVNCEVPCGDGIFPGYEKLCYSYCAVFMRNKERAAQRLASERLMSEVLTMTTSTPFTNDQSDTSENPSRLRAWIPLLTALIAVLISLTTVLILTIMLMKRRRARLQHTFTDASTETSPSLERRHKNASTKTSVSVDLSEKNAYQDKECTVQMLQDQDISHTAFNEIRDVNHYVTDWMSTRIV